MTPLNSTNHKYIVTQNLATIWHCDVTSCHMFILSHTVADSSVSPEVVDYFTVANKN